MMTVKKGLIGILTIMMIFIGGCYGTQTGVQRSDDGGSLRGGQITPPTGGYPTEGVGGIGILPGGSY